MIVYMIAFDENQSKYIAFLDTDQYYGYISDIPYDARTLALLKAREKMVR